MMPPRLLPELSAAEWAVMQVVWERREAVARDVFEALQASEGWAVTTVRTMMERLAKKGYLKQKRVGPVWLYTPAVERRRAIGASFKELLQRLTPSGAQDLIAYAVEDAELTNEQLDALEKLIQNRRGKSHESRD